MATNSKKLSILAYRIMGMIMIILSVALLGFGGVQAWRGMEKKNTWSKVTAMVTSLEPVRGRRGRTSYKAWFAFQDPATNRSYTVKSNWSSNPPSFQRGQRVELLYPAANPEEAVANTFTEVFFWALIAGIGGLVLGICGLALRFGKRDDGDAPDEQPTEEPAAE